MVLVKAELNSESDCKTTPTVNSRGGIQHSTVAFAVPLYTHEFEFPRQFALLVTGTAFSLHFIVDS